jgi:hypothetical protein
MNRLFFRPEHAGMTKTDAAAQTLGESSDTKHLMTVARSCVHNVTASASQRN